MKDYVLDQFMLFHAMVERETWKNSKCLRIDDECEYNYREFYTYCRKHVIQHERTVPPPHNIMV